MSQFNQAITNTNFRPISEKTRSAVQPYSETKQEIVTSRLYLDVSEWLMAAWI